MVSLPALRWLALTTTIQLRFDGVITMKQTLNWNAMATEPAGHAEIYREEMASLLTEVRMINADATRASFAMIDHFGLVGGKKSADDIDPFFADVIRDMAHASNRSRVLVERLAGHHP